MSAVSSILKHTSASTRRRAPFRSSGWSASSNPGSLVIVSGQELGPTHASHRSLTAIMITTSNSSMKEERDAQSITRCSTAHHGDFRALPRANRTFSTAGNSIPYASSRTGERRAGGPLQPSQSSVPAAAPGVNIYCAIPADCAP
jgi:hypothetical protein